MMCSFCCKQFASDELKPAKNDDHPELERVYCKRCLEEYVNDVILPWERKKLLDDFR